MTVTINPTTPEFSQTDEQIIADVRKHRKLIAKSLAKGSFFSLDSPYSELVLELYGKSNLMQPDVILKYSELDKKFNDKPILSWRSIYALEALESFGVMTLEKYPTGGADRGYCKINIGPVGIELGAILSECKSQALEHIRKTTSASK